jgi:hypothetical protein
LEKFCNIFLNTFALIDSLQFLYRIIAKLPQKNFFWLSLNYRKGKKGQLQEKNSLFKLPQGGK